MYLSGAKITRHATFTLGKGANHVAFVDLSTSLDEETIQLSTDSDFILRSISKKLNATIGNLYEAQLEELKSQKKELESRINELKTEFKVLQQKKELLSANQDLSGENAGLNIADLKGAMDYFSQTFKEIESRSVDVRNKIEAVSKQMAEVNKQIQKYEVKRTESAGIIEAVIYSPTLQKVDVEIVYTTSNAYWYPSYSIHAGDVNEPLRLTYKANIRQNTGIDWNETKLTISSGRPRGNLNTPDLDPFYVDFESERRINLNADFDLNEKLTPPVRPTEMKAPPAPRRVKLQEGQATFSFQIQTPFTIQSGAGSKTINVKNHALPAVYRYIAIPKLSEKVYLTAKVTGWGKLHLLPGEANLFLGSTYVGMTIINANITADTLRIPLGSDEGIKVKRTRIDEFSEKNFFGNKTTQTIAWRIELQNSKQAPVEVTVLDQIPRSKNEDIEVNITKRSGAAFIASTGLLRWNIDLKGGEKYTIIFSYEIEYPSDKKIDYQ